MDGGGFVAAAMESRVAVSPLTFGEVNIGIAAVGVGVD